MTIAEQVEDLARILHESGREAVSKKLVYRDDLPVKPFCEWCHLPNAAKEGRRLQAQYLVANASAVIDILTFVSMEGD